MNVVDELKNIVLSLHQTVADQSSVYVKKYSIIKSQFGTYIELYIFKNCSGISVRQILRFAKQVVEELKKDLTNNQYIDLERTILPDINDLIIYGGKNQAYVGFSDIIYCTDIYKAIQYFKKIGYKN